MEQQAPLPLALCATAFGLNVVLHAVERNAPLIGQTHEGRGKVLALGPALTVQHTQHSGVIVGGHVTAVLLAELRLGHLELASNLIPLHRSEAHHRQQNHHARKAIGQKTCLAPPGVSVPRPLVLFGHDVFEARLIRWLRLAQPAFRKHDACLEKLGGPHARREQANAVCRRAHHTVKRAVPPCAHVLAQINLLALGHRKRNVGADVLPFDICLQIRRDVLPVELCRVGPARSNTRQCVGDLKRNGLVGRRIVKLEPKAVLLLAHLKCFWIAVRTGFKLHRRAVRARADAVNPCIHGASLKFPARNVPEDTVEVSSKDIASPLHNLERAIGLNHRIDVDLADGIRPCPRLASWHQERQEQTNGCKQRPRTLQITRRGNLHRQSPQCVALLKRVASQLSSTSYRP